MKTSFSKVTMVMRFPAKKNAVAYKHRAISSQGKMAFSTPGRVVLGLPSPSPRVCTDVRWRHNPLAMELRWRALPAGSIKKNCCEGKVTEEFWPILPKVQQKNSGVSAGVYAGEIGIISVLKMA